MTKKTHFDRLYERKGISLAARDKGNAELAKMAAEKESTALEMVNKAIARAAKYPAPK